MTDRARILVVDDETALRRVYVRWLESAGYAVEQAGDGEAAARLIAEQRFDVIVSDIGIPTMDGIQLLRTVRERDRDVPVILMTGAPAASSAISAVELGALRYLVKPFGIDVLRGVVIQALRLHELARLKREALAIGGGRRSVLGDDAGLTARLDGALASLRIAFQPIVQWSTKDIYAFEALLRSSEPTLPHPGAVLEAAEQLGRLDEVGRAVRDRVAGVIADAPAPYVFVNLHTRDLLDESLYSRDAPLSRHADRVVLEITERASLDDVPGTVHRIRQLRDMGFRIAVDDLGAGYAGLTTFAQLEPEVVKFDMSLIRDVDTHATKRKLLQSMIRLFAELGLAVVAEGVETVGERDALVAAGCDLFQGFLFARPGEPFPVVGW